MFTRINRRCSQRQTLEVPVNVNTCGRSDGVICVIISTGDCHLNELCALLEMFISTRVILVSVPFAFDQAHCGNGGDSSVRSVVRGHE